MLTILKLVVAQQYVEPMYLGLDLSIYPHREDKCWRAALDKLQRGEKLYSWTLPLRRA